MPANAVSPETLTTNKPTAMLENGDTIAAIATPPGIGGIGIIRISGPQALAIGETLGAAPLQDRQVRFRQFLDTSGEPIDHGICFYCQAPHSFSGEDVVEIQGHGGPILLDMLLQRICELGARLARAGEFTERAFLNGKLDLTQAEAIADLIESGSRAAAKAAMRSLQGQFSDQLQALAEEILALRTYVEAALDFSEEEIDFLSDVSINDGLKACVITLNQILAQAEWGRVLNEGLNIVLAGLPNAGKSSLLNYLAGYEAAIVSDQAGTTRDVVREHLSLNGIPLHIKDTAGLRMSNNAIEQQGVDRAWQEIEHADKVLLLVDASAGMTEADNGIANQLKADDYYLIYSKSDLVTATHRDPDACYISTYTGEGMDALITMITGACDFNQDNRTILSRRRHLDALVRARDKLIQAQTVLLDTQSGELVAEDLRNAHNQLCQITGQITTEELLGSIFSRFCVGK